MVNPVRASLNIPCILSRFVYICRPLTGGIDGCSGCLLLCGEPDVDGGGEYAGGSSPGTEGGYDGLLRTKTPILGCRLTDKGSTAGLFPVSRCLEEVSKIISKRLDGKLIHQVTCAVESVGVSGEVRRAKLPYKLRRTCRQPRERMGERMGLHSHDCAALNARPQQPVRHDFGRAYRIHHSFVIGLTKTTKTNVAGEFCAFRMWCSLSNSITSPHYFRVPERLGWRSFTPTLTYVEISGDCGPQRSLLRRMMFATSSNTLPLTGSEYR